MLSLESIEKSLNELEAQLGKSKSKSVTALCDEKNLIMRHLTLLFHSKESRRYRRVVSHNLSFILCQKSGLAAFINATCDLDQSSQKLTTFDQRFRAMSVIISDMPTLCCSKEEYYSALSGQLLQLLSAPEKGRDIVRIQWKISSYIASALNHKDPKLFELNFLRTLIDTIKCDSPRFVSPLPIHDCILVVHHLITNNFDKQPFVQIIPHLFFIGAMLHPTPSSFKGPLLEIFIDFIEFVDHSLYLIDDALFNKVQVYERYRIDTILHGEETVITVSPIGDDKPETEISRVDKIVQYTLYLFQNFMGSCKLDFFLLMIERFSTISSKNLLLCSLIDAMQENASELLLEQPSKAIRFVNAHLKRMLLNCSGSVDFTTETANVSEVLKTDSIAMVLQILSIILEDKNQLNHDDILSLRECSTNLSLIKEDYLEEKLRAESIVNIIDTLDTKKCEFGQSKTKCEFHEAVIGLNSKFMPTRAHSLIELKRMVDRKSVHIEQNIQTLVTLFKESLCDPESYVYLAAINALASLSISHTAETLPILVEAFHDHLRTVEERVNVGQVLVQLSKRIGDFAHHYSKIMVDCFLRGFKDENVTIRVSSISNLSQFCAILRYALSYYIIEIVFAIEYVLKNDPFIEVKRACVMFITMLFDGLDKSTIQVVKDELVTLYRMIKNIEYKVLSDEAIRIHISMALERIDARIKELFTVEDPRFRKVVTLID